MQYPNVYLFLYQVNSDGKTLHYNPYSWNKVNCIDCLYDYFRMRV